MNQDRKQFIADLRGRATILFPSARERLTKFLDQSEKNGTEDNLKKLVDLKRAALSDNTKLQEYNKLRTLAIDNLIVPSSNAASFFSTINLEADEEPMLENTTGIEMKARLLGEDGKPHMTQIIKQLARQMIPLSYIGTRELEYPLNDLYKGRVSNDVLNAAPLARDLGLAIDVKLWTLIKALPLATFNNSNSNPAKRTFVLHSAIVAANVPTGNLINLSGEGAFNFNVIKGIVKYFMTLGNIFDGPIVPEVIFVPSIDITAFIDQVTLTSEGTNPAVQQIFQDGYVTNMGGRKLAIVGDAMLDPAAGLAYIRTNRAIGEHYMKTALDINYPESTSQIPPDWIRENKGRTFMKKVFGAVTPLPWTVNMAAVKYK